MYNFRRRIFCRFAKDTSCSVFSDGMCTPEELIKKIMTTENPFNCPHGRPTLIQISQLEIEKLFGRKK